MRILTAALVAAFFTAGSVAAYAQDAAPAPVKTAKTAKVKCSKKAEAECVAPDCTWTAGTGSAKGKCTKAKKAK
jgi:hypothetical protein